jgi:hypothetical protein
MQNIPRDFFPTSQHSNFPVQDIFRDFSTKQHSDFPIQTISRDLPPINTANPMHNISRVFSPTSTDIPTYQQSDFSIYKLPGPSPSTGSTPALHKTPGTDIKGIPTAKI